MFIFSRRLVILVLLAAFAHAEDLQGPPPRQFQFGKLALRPFAFLDLLGQFRSATTGDTISTRFARFPLTDTPAEALGSVAHSRTSLKATLPATGYTFSAYYEMDFLNAIGQPAYRTRHLFGQVDHGKWQLVAGKTWSLLRPNRSGLAPEKSLFNTDVIEPAYHIGLAGFRRDQLRLSRLEDNWGLSFSFERRNERTGADLLMKTMREWGKVHVEATGLAAAAGRRAVSVSAQIPVASWARFVTQEFIARHCASEALNVLAVGVSGGSFLQGLEANVTKRVELYSYAGVVYGSRTASGNRFAREWTAGGMRKIDVPEGYGSLRAGLQFSMLDREVWSQGHGGLNQLMLQLRYETW